MDVETLQRELTAFDDAAEWKTLDARGHHWRYATVGHGAEPLMLIHGGGGDARTMFRYATHLAPEFTVIVPTLPPSIDNTADLTAGLAAVLDREGVETANVFGPSLGGWVTQAFAAHHPDRTGRCVISHCGLPQPDQVGRLKASLRFIGLLPFGLFRRMFLRGFRKSLETDVPDITNDEVSFWISLIEPVFDDGMTKDGVLAMMRFMIDFHGNSDLSASPLRREADRVVLVHHEHDDEVDEQARAEMRAFYPHAEAIVLPAYGHAAGLARADLVIEAVRTFLRPPGPPSDDRTTRSDDQ